MGRLTKRGREPTPRVRSYGPLAVGLRRGWQALFGLGGITATVLVGGALKGELDVLTLAVGVPVTVILFLLGVIVEMIEKTIFPPKED